MKYQTPAPVATESSVLTDFSSMEARCVASQEQLKAGDVVLVVYIAQIGEGDKGAVKIPLEVPLIVKAERAEKYVDQILEIMERKVLELKVSPFGETVQIVKVESKEDPKPVLKQIEEAAQQVEQQLPTQPS